MILIIATFHEKEMTIAIGQELLQKRLIACYSLFPVESSYQWKGKLMDEKEFMMIMKTQTKHFDEIAEFIKNYSDYEIPEVVALPPEKVHEAYLQWVMKETTQDSQ